MQIQNVPLSLDHLTHQPHSLIHTMKNIHWIIFHSFISGVQFVLLVMALRDGMAATALWSACFLLLGILTVMANLYLIQDKKAS